MSFNQVLFFSNDGAYHHAKMYTRAGGVARNHADALTRLGASASLIAAIGEDGFAVDLRHKCNHMIAIFNSQKGYSTPTSLSIVEKGQLMNGFLDVEETIRLIDAEFVSLFFSSLLALFCLASSTRKSF